MPVPLGAQPEDVCRYSSMHPRAESIALKGSGHRRLPATDTSRDQAGATLADVAAEPWVAGAAAPRRSAGLASHRTLRRGPE